MKRVWVNGTFDVMHLGHIKLLEYAASLGVVRVGIDSDSRVKMRKGSSRPFNDQDSRVAFMQSIRYVNDVVVFDSALELLSAIKEYNPHYLVVGDDYSGRENLVIGSSYAKEVKIFNRLKDLSTTKILSHSLY